MKHWSDKIPEVQLNHIFKCDGKLYAIATPTSASCRTNLSDGRIIAEFVVISE